MGKANNSIVKIKDVIDSGGIRNEAYSASENTDKLIKDVDITTGTIPLAGPMFYNTMLNRKYGDNHLTKFQHLNILETYPIILTVETSSTAWTGYTLYGFEAKVTYPNGSSIKHPINITETTSNKNITIENCCNDATIRIITTETSGASMSSLLGTFDAKVEINSNLTSDQICTGPQNISCFSLSRQTGPIIPDEPILPDTGTGETTRFIDIVLKNGDGMLFSEVKLGTGTTTYATGTTSTFDGDEYRVLMSELNEGMVFGPVNAGAEITRVRIEVPSNAYVEITLPSYIEGRASNLLAYVQYNWENSNVQIVPPGTNTVEVIYKIGDVLLSPKSSE